MTERQIEIIYFCKIWVLQEQVQAEEGSAKKSEKLC